MTKLPPGPEYVPPGVDTSFSEEHTIHAPGLVTVIGPQTWVAELAPDAEVEAPIGVVLSTPRNARQHHAPVSVPPLVIDQEAPSPEITRRATQLPESSPVSSTWNNCVQDAFDMDAMSSEAQANRMHTSPSTTPAGFVTVNEVTPTNVPFVEATNEIATTAYVWEATRRS
jgi:hypothetical protein